jgi:hypothetical protein
MQQTNLIDLFSVNHTKCVEHLHRLDLVFIASHLIIYNVQSLLHIKIVRTRIGFVPRLIIRKSNYLIQIYFMHTITHYMCMLIKLLVRNINT